MHNEFDNLDNFDDNLELAESFGRHHGGHPGGHPGMRHPRHHQHRHNCRPVCSCGRFGCHCAVRCNNRWFW